MRAASASSPAATSRRRSLAAAIAEVWDASSRPFGVNLFVPAQANAYPVGPGELTGADRAVAVAAYRDALAADAQTVGAEPGEPRPGDDDDWERKVDLVVRERVPVVSFTFGLPSTAVLGALRRSGTETVATVTDLEEARAALEAGVDGLCVQGPDGGGHRGTLDAVKQPSDLDLVDLVVAVRAETDVPVVAAGGISTAEHAARVRAAGADAVQIGTALLLTPEAGTGLAYRRALGDPAYTGTAVTRAYSGRLGPRPRDRLPAPARRAGSRRLPRGAPPHGAAPAGVGQGGAARPARAVGGHGMALGAGRAGGHGRRGARRPLSSGDGPARRTGRRHTVAACRAPRET